MDIREFRIDDPTKAIQNPKFRKPLPQPLSQDEALEQLKKKARVSGPVYGEPASVLDVEWHGGDTVEVVYRSDSGQVGTVLLSRADEVRALVVDHLIQQLTKPSDMRFRVFWGGVLTHHFGILHSDVFKRRTARSVSASAPLTLTSDRSPRSQLRLPALQLSGLRSWRPFQGRVSTVRLQLRRQSQRRSRER